MQIRDLTLNDVREGKNWKGLASVDFWESSPLETLPIAECGAFEPNDYVVYSALFVTDSGDVTPLVVIKEVQNLEYWGDSCEFVDGSWRQVGLTPNPQAPFGDGYVADPLETDGSFGEEDCREYHRQNFRKYVGRL
jgi:hypothetical protein